MCGGCITSVPVVMCCTHPPTARLLCPFCVNAVLCTRPVSGFLPWRDFGLTGLWWSGLQSFKVETPLRVTACLVSLHGHTVVPASGSRITLPCTCVHKFGCGCVSHFLCVHT